MNNKQIRIGVDVGGTNIAIGLVDSNYKIIRETSVKTAQHSSPSQMADIIAIKVKELLHECDLSAEDVKTLGVGLPGTVNQDNGQVEYANNLGFENVPFRDLMEASLGQDLSQKLVMDNDANAAAVGEYVVGGYRADNFVMVTLGTGIGGGLIIGGKLIRGVNYAAAEIGHMTINCDGIDCNCGRKGCFEDYASATALVEQAREALTQDASKSSKMWISAGEKFENVDGKVIFDAVREGDELAIKVLNQYTYYLSEGITDIINFLQPEVLTLAGGVTRAGDLFLDQLKELVSEKIYSRTSKKNTEIKIADAIEDAGDVGIIGAACLGDI